MDIEIYLIDTRLLFFRKNNKTKSIYNLIEYLNIKMENADRTNYGALIKRFPEQLKEALKISRDLKVYDAITNITVAGMGGSGFGDDIVSCCFLFFI